MSEVTCMKCGESVPESQAYIEAGGHICLDCFTDAEVKEGFATPYKSMALSAFFAGFLSFCFNPFFIFSVAGIIAGFGTLTYTHGLDEEEREMINEMTWPKVCSLIGLVLALLGGLVHLLPNLGMALSFLE